MEHLTGTVLEFMVVWMSPARLTRVGGAAALSYWNKDAGFVELVERMPRRSRWRDRNTANTLGDR